MPQTTRREDFKLVVDGHPRTVDTKAPLSASLDKDPYINPAWISREWQGVWSRCWLFAGLAADVPASGDYFVYELARESIIVMRQPGGELAAFYNSCQHRGNRIITEARGQLQRLRCPYHGWSYALDGQLQGVPSRKKFPGVIDAGSHSLQPVAVAELHGLVWINMAENPAPLPDYLGSIAELLEPYQLSRMLLAQHQTLSLQANWKTLRDNFLEQYHVDFIHPQHADIVDCDMSLNILYPFGHSATQVQGFLTDSKYPVPEQIPGYLAPLLQGLGLDLGDFDGRVPALRTAVQQQKRQLAAEFGFDYGALSDDQLTDVVQIDVFPNLFLTIQAEQVAIFSSRPHPDDPDRCWLDKWTLQVPREQATDDQRGLSLAPGLLRVSKEPRPALEQFTREDILKQTHSLTMTFDQDVFYLQDMQKGMHSRGYQAATLNAEEIRIQHFHDWLDSWLVAVPHALDR